MGYGYTFRLTVDCSIVIDPKAFNLFLEQAKSLYSKLKHRERFPIFGVQDYSGSKGYGMGPNKHLIPEFILFTSAFPDFTFTLWMTFYDNMCLYTVTIKNDQIISEFEKDFEAFDVGNGLSISIMLNMDSLILGEDELVELYSDTD